MHRNGVASYGTRPRKIRLNTQWIGFASNGTQDTWCVLAVLQSHYTPTILVVTRLCANRPCACLVFMSALETLPRSHASGPTRHSYRWFHQVYAANHTPPIRDMKIIKSFIAYPLNNAVSNTFTITYTIEKGQIK
jgi:hypothetical protein